MSENHISDEAYDRAYKRVNAKIGFFIHLAVYICAVALVVGINMSFTTTSPWLVGPMAGWALGLFFHGASVFLFASGGRIKQRMIDREAARQQTAMTPPPGRVPDVPRREDEGV